MSLHTVLFATNKEIKELGLIKVRCINYKPNEKLICTSPPHKCISVFGCKTPFYVDWIDYIKYSSELKVIKKGE